MQRAHERSVEVVTALLHDDTQLARRLVLTEPNPRALAWDALVLLAGMVETSAMKVNEKPTHYWARALIGTSH